MITLTDAQRFSEESPAIKSFKPWWEILIDHMLLASLLICLLAWARVTSTEASGLVCVPLISNISYGYTEFRYANSRCSQEFATKLILYYPYLLLFQWIVTFLVQKAWLKVPVVVTKLDAFHDIFCQMCSITPTFIRNKRSYQMLPELTFEGENFDQVKVLHDKLMFLLTEMSYLLRIYRAKIFILLAISFVFATGMVIWLYVIYIPKADIKCHLEGDKTAHEFKSLICNFSSAFFLYSAMCLNLIMLCLVIVFSSYGLFWSFRQKSFAEHTGIFGQMIDLYTGLPGFNDLQFCMSLVRSNVRDGNLMFETIKSCLRQQAYQLDEKNNIRAKADRARDFGQEHGIVKLIAQQLGLQLINNRQDANHLFGCLAYIRSCLSHVELEISSELRDRLADEIQRNPLHFKSTIDNDTKEGTYDQVIEEMRLPFTFGNQYAVAAAANVFKVRIVVIHCQSTSEYREVFEPFAGNQSRGTFFLTFTGKHYYHSTKKVQKADDDFERFVQARVRFAQDDKYRNSIRQSASRSIERSDEGESTQDKISAIPESTNQGMTSESFTKLLDFDQDRIDGAENGINLLQRYKRKFGMFRDDKVVFNV